MSLVRCATNGCTHHVRKGLRRRGRGVDGAELADGVFCWRCRRRQNAKVEPIGTTRVRIQLDFQIEVPGADQPLPRWPLRAVKIGIQELLDRKVIPYDRVEMLGGATFKVRVVDERRRARRRR